MWGEAEKGRRRMRAFALFGGKAKFTHAVVEAETWEM